MDVEYETDHLVSNHSLETEYDTFTVEYSQDNSSKTLTEILNKTDYSESLMSTGNDICANYSAFDERNLKQNLGWTVLVVAAYTLIFFIGFVGNCMVILVVIKRSQMRTITNMFIMNLAVADLLVIIFCIPSDILENIYRSWTLGHLMCKGVPYMQSMSVGASAYSLAAISLNRCKAICHPQVPPRGLSKRKVLFTISLIWTITITLSVPWAMVHKLIGPYTTSCVSYCIQSWENPLYIDIYYLVVLVFLFYCLPLILVFIANIIIWFNVSKRKVPQESASTTRIDRMHRESRQSVGKILGIVTFAFLVSWLPLYALATKHIVTGELRSWESDILIPLAQWLGASNSSINPVLYAFLSKRFREMFKSLLPCIYRTEKNCDKKCGLEATNDAFSLNSTGTESHVTQLSRETIIMSIKEEN